MEIGLFDIHQIDPTDQDGHAAVYRRRLDHLALADELGLRYAFTAERHFLQTYRCPAPGAWLGAASQRTRQMRLGVLAYTLPIQPAAALAEEVAVLDHLTGGRLDVGLGLGHRPEELAALGVNPATRIEIFQERLMVLRALWSGGKISLTSEHHTLTDVAIYPLPMQEPHPPLWFAGTQPAATSWAGAHGLHLAVGFAPLRDLVPATAAFRAGRMALEKATTEDPPPAEGGRIALMRHVYLAETDDRARSEMIDDLVALRSHDGASEGSRADRRRSAESDLDDLLRREAFVAGSPHTVADRIWQAHRAISADLFLANLYPAHVDDERVRRAIRMLAGEVSTALDEKTKAAATV